MFFIGSPGEIRTLVRGSRGPDNNEEVIETYESDNDSDGDLPQYDGPADSKSSKYLYQWEHLSHCILYNILRGPRLIVRFLACIPLLIQ